jgi:hypothetical protein
MRITDVGSSLWRGWSDFWFAPVSLFNLAVFRILFCGTLCLMYLSRQPDVALYFTDRGILPRSLSSEILPEFYRPLVHFTFWSDAWVPWVHGFFIVSLLLLCLGIGGRTLTWIATFLHISFLQRNYSIAFGADQISVIFLFYLAFTQSCAELSVTHLWRKKKETASPRPVDAFTSMGYRLIQVQLCVIYAFSGFEKLKGSSWWDGTALWTVLANSQMVIADFTFVRHIPIVVALISFSTIAFEVYFPALVWNPKTRKWVLGLGVFFHTMIAITMALYSFALVMISPYLLFLQERTVRRLIHGFRSLILRQQAPSSTFVL